MTKLNFLLFSLIGIFLLNCQNKKEASNSSSVTEEVVEAKTPTSNVNFNACGEGTPTLLFIHGWGINQSYWESQKSYFCENYHVVTLDLPGFGKSVKLNGETTIEKIGGEVTGLISELDLNNILLIGHSMGGDIILEIALNLPDKVIGFVGVDNFKDVGLESGPEEKQQMDSFVASLESNYTFVAQSFSRNFLFHPTTDSTIVERVVADIVNSDSVVAHASIKSLFNYPEVDKLKDLQHKIYLINSDATPTYEEGLKNHVQDYEILSIGATGHYPMVEKPNEFNSLLEQIIGKITVGTN